MFTPIILRKCDGKLNKSPPISNTLLSGPLSKRRNEHACFLLCYIGISSLFNISSILVVDCPQSESAVKLSFILSIIFALEQYFCYLPFLTAILTNQIKLYFQLTAHYGITESSKT